MIGETNRWRVTSKEESIIVSTLKYAMLKLVEGGRVSKEVIILQDTHASSLRYLKIQFVIVFHRQVAVPGEVDAATGHVLLQGHILGQTSNTINRIRAIEDCKTLNRRHEKD